MKILLKNAIIRTQNKEEIKTDILIKNQVIKKINKNIENKDADFTLFLEKKVTTPSLILNHPESILTFEDLANTVQDGIKMGCTDFIFSLGNIKFIDKIIKLFKKTHIRGLFIINEDIDFKEENIYFTKKIENPENFLIKLYNKPKYIEEGKDASLIIWDTKKSLTIPYIVISQGKIITREGSFIFL